MKIRRFSFLCQVIIVLFVLLQSCATKRNLVYFSNLPDSTILQQAILEKASTIIQVGDALAIKVTTLNPDANILFNSGSLPMNNESTGVSSGVSSTAVLSEGYVVDAEGYINFPVIGKIKLAGLTKEEAQSVISDEVKKTAKGPIVNIRILNFNITVIGEVAHPGSFSVPNNKINVLQALGMAGDMTPFAVRENVLVIHEGDGNRTMQRLNLTDKSIFQSPSFYLKQNDIVYVTPVNELKAKQANPNRFQIWSLLISSVSTLALTIYYISRSN